MFEHEEAFFEAHKEEFKAEYPHKHLIIADGAVFGVYDSVEQAVNDAMKHFEPGKFMLQSIDTCDEIMRFASRVYV
jgi:hypothetical protein